MRLAVLVTVLCLAGCSSLPSMSEQGFLGQSAWRHRQAMQDADIIMQGMSQARAHDQRLARQSR